MGRHNREKAITHYERAGHKGEPPRAARLPGQNAGRHAHHEQRQKPDKVAIYKPRYSQETHVQGGTASRNEGWGRGSERHPPGSSPDLAQDRKSTRLNSSH